jgi:hypothetical protein
MIYCLKIMVRWAYEYLDTPRPEGGGPSNLGYRARYVKPS